MYLIQKLQELETSKRSIDEDLSRERAQANKEIKDLNLKVCDWLISCLDDNWLI